MRGNTLFPPAVAGIRSFMLSFLAARSSVLGAEFETRHAGSWLVWEPGRWRAPVGADQENTVEGSHHARTPVPGDALCFQLHVAGDIGPLRVGRDLQRSELVLNDATVSRLHAYLVSTGPDAWSVEPAKDRAVRVDGRLVDPGSSTRLTRGSALVLGSVRLTWYDPAGFQARLRAAREAQ